VSERAGEEELRTITSRCGPLGTPPSLITIGVDAIDESLKKVEAGGGSIVQPRTEIPEMGAFAYFKDSEGNVVGLWETF
jgi:hypothetical protein